MFSSCSSLCHGAFLSWERFKNRLLTVVVLYHQTTSEILTAPQGLSVLFAYDIWQKIQQLVTKTYSNVQLDNAMLSMRAWMRTKIIINSYNMCQNVISEVAENRTEHSIPSSFEYCFEIMNIYINIENWNTVLVKCVVFICQVFNW